MRLVAKTTCDIVREYTDLVSAIRMSAELREHKLEPNHPAMADVTRIVRASNEAAELTRDLRSVLCGEGASGTVSHESR